MRVIYWEKTDTMYLLLNGNLEGYDSEEVAPGVVLDFTKDGELVGIEVYDKASEKFDLSVLAAEGLPVEVRTASADGADAAEAKTGERART